MNSIYVEDSIKAMVALNIFVSDWKSADLWENILKRMSPEMDQLKSGLLKIYILEAFSTLNAENKKIANECIHNLSFDFPLEYKAHKEVIDSLLEKTE